MQAAESLTHRHQNALTQAVDAAGVPYVSQASSSRVGTRDLLKIVVTHSLTHSYSHAPPLSQCPAALRQPLSTNLAVLTFTRGPVLARLPFCRISQPASRPAYAPCRAVSRRVASWSWGPTDQAGVKWRGVQGKRHGWRCVCSDGDSWGRVVCGTAGCSCWGRSCQWGTMIGPGMLRWSAPVRDA